MTGVKLMYDELDSYKQAIFTNFHNRNVGSNPLTLAMKVEWDRNFNATLKIKEGRNYFKVITGTSVHSFIVKNDGAKFKKGDILKAANWESPAKNFPRGNVFNMDSFKNVSWTGA